MCGLKFLDVAILWYGVKNMNRLIISFLFILLLGGCRTDEAEPQRSQQQSPQAVATAPAKVGCKGCHDTVILDAAHQLACTSCHGGVDDEGNIEKAHAGLIAQPAHPEQMAATCGGCHPKQVTAASRSLHFTLENKINTVRLHFGAETRLNSPVDIPVATSLNDPLALADDMLRRRCLRCHVYAQGDDYAAVAHGTGCSACHLTFKDRKLQSHAFKAPTDKQCLSCHYGNYVGSDYHGQYEHDYNWEYRTPYTTKTASNTIPRPYGVESHDLATDIHQQRGLVCIDCHRDSGHGPAAAITCRTCHDWQPGQPAPPERNLQVRDTSLILTARDGKEHAVPPLRHPAHRQYGRQVACQVCHGQWSVNDAPTHLLLSKVPEYEAWERLTVQASSEVEVLLNQNLYYSDELPLTMRDGLTGTSRPGIWYQGYGQRRWEQMIVQKDTDGVIKVFRPLLDLRLSMVEADGQVPFDNVLGQGSGLLPYTPHTTGHAGLFYLDRFKHLLPPDNK
jgi:hypothetical protein